MNLSRLRPEKKSGEKSFARAQRLMAEVVMHPLPSDAREESFAGTYTHEKAKDLIKPSRSLSGFERLEIYNRQYWYRLLDCLVEDFPGVAAIVGQRKFKALCEAYLAKHPSTTFNLVDLGDRLPQFIRDNPSCVAPHMRMAYETAMVELGEAKAMTAAERPPLRIEQQVTISAQAIALKLQPHISLFALNYEIDDFLISFKRDTPLQLLSNAHLHKPDTRRKRACPISRKNYLVVHRSKNIVYFKRLSRIEYLALCPFVNGATIQEACDEVFQKAGRQMSEERLATELSKSFSEWSSWQFFIAGDEQRS